MNDKGAQVKKAYPGEAVHMVGFNQFPDVGNPLYVVKNREEAKFIIDRLKHREEALKHKALAESGEGHLAHDLKKQIGKLTRQEKVAIKRGDKTVLYTKMGLVEDADLKRYQTKFGISDDALESTTQLTENLADKNILGKKRQRSRYHKNRQLQEKDRFVDMLDQIDQRKQAIEGMDDEERRQMEAHQAKMKAVFREDGDDEFFCPLIIKTNQAGVLETILTETEKIVGPHYQIQVVESGVGPISEADISSAISTGSKIIAFDVSCSKAIESKASASGVVVRVHKLIYKFTEDLEDIVHDMHLIEAKARGETMIKEQQGQASVLQTFNVTSTKGKKEATVFGSRIFAGSFETKHKYRVTRDDEEIYSGLVLQSLRHHKNVVSKLEKGNECGLCFEPTKYELDIQRGDVIESYTETEQNDEKFTHKPGVSKTF